MGPDAPPFDRPIAIFPLPNRVLLPRAILPLHIFEPRYREMVRDCLSGDGHFAMAVLKPGYEEKYYTHVAPIRDMLCVGKIVRHERLDDGRYNILLQGAVRAKVISEDREREYRRGVLRAVSPIDVGPVEAEAWRRRICEALSSPAVMELAVQCRWIEAARSPDLPISDVIDFLASTLSCDVGRTMSFLEEPNVAQRGAMLVEYLRKLVVQPASDKKPTATTAVRAWPRQTVIN